MGKIPESIVEINQLPQLMEQTFAGYTPYAPDMDKGDVLQEVARRLLHANYQTLSTELLRVTAARVTSQARRDAGIHERKAPTTSWEGIKERTTASAASVETEILKREFWEDILRLVGPQKATILFSDVMLDMTDTDLAKRMGVERRAIARWRQEATETLRKNTDFRDAWEPGIAS